MKNSVGLKKRMIVVSVNIRQVELTILDGMSWSVRIELLKIRDQNDKHVI